MNYSFAYVFITALSLVLIKFSATHIDPFLSLTICSLIAAFVFHLINGRHIFAAYQAAWLHRKRWLTIMVLVTLVWISTFWGASINEALFVLLFFSTTAIWGFIHKFKAAQAREKKILLISLFGLALSSITLVILKTNHYDLMLIAKILFSGIIGGIAGYLYQAQSHIFFQETQLSASAILAIRFWLLIILVMPFIDFTNTQILSVPSNLVTLGLMALMTFILPLYANQKGILTAGPELNAIICGYTPVVAYLLGILVLHQPYELKVLILNLIAGFCIGLPLLWHWKEWGSGKNQKA